MGAQELTIRGATDDEAARVLSGRLGALTSTSQGLTGVKDILGESQAFAVCEGEELRAVYSLKVSQQTGGAVVWVTGAAQCRGGGLVGSVLPAIEGQARQAGASQVAAVTRRRGLIRKMVQQGYEVTGVVLRKRV